MADSTDIALKMLYLMYLLLKTMEENMKRITLFLLIAVLALGTIVTMTSCSKDAEPTKQDQGTSEFFSLKAQTDQPLEFAAGMTLYLATRQRL